MTAPTTARQKVLAQIGSALKHLHAAYHDDAEPYTRADAMLIDMVMRRADWADLLKTAAQSAGRQDDRLDSFVDVEMHSPRFHAADYLPDDERRLTPAEFHCLRQQLGLSTRWLAERWDVAERSVQRWENSRMLPLEFSVDMLDLRDRQRREIQNESDSVRRTQSGIMVPRKNIMAAEYPAEWWQIIAWHVHEQTGATILYDDDYTEDLEPEPDGIGGDGDE